VEDNKINELLGVRLLESWDVSVDVASTGVQAIDMVQIKNYDIVLMDVLMPEMDGIEATKRIRKLGGEKYKHLPIIALTAIATVEAKEKILQSGMNDFISKPFNINDLYSKIENHLIKKNLGSLWSKDSN
jgi:CheY-like chemotaxis protein